MKRKLYFAAVAAMALVSCKDPVGIMPETSSGLVRLDLSLDSGETKSVGLDEENRIADVQVYVFNAEGVIEAYRLQEYKNETLLSTAKTSVECTPGTKTIVALVNTPKMPDVKSYDDLTSRTSNLADNSTVALQMTGKVSAEITSSSEISIPVSRIAAKVTIASITNKMALEYYQNMSFSITNIYMLNVAGDTGYMEDKDPVVWYNMSKRQDTGGLRYMLQRNNSVPLVVKYPETVSLTPQQEHPYYVYPNGTESDNSDAEWSPRYTRMVLEARLGSETYYYPVSIPNVERNTAYEVHLTVTRPGSASPDIPVDVQTASVTVNVVEWTDAADINETI